MEDPNATSSTDTSSETVTEEVPQISKEEARAALFYRPYSRALKSPGRRETRDYIRSRQRLIPMNKGDQPLTREVMKHFFRGRDESK